MNKRESEAAKKEVILRDYPLLRDDLKRLLRDLSTPVVLVKANVCRLLEPRLTADGFNVINKGQSVSFPAFGQQPDFHRQFRTILKSAKILSDGSDAPSPRPHRPRRKKRPAEEIGNATLTDYLKEAGKLVLTTFIKEFPNALLTAFKRYEHVGAGEMVDMQQRKLHEAMEEVCVKTTVALLSRSPKKSTDVGSILNVTAGWCPHLRSVLVPTNTPIYLFAPGTRFA